MPMQAVPAQEISQPWHSEGDRETRKEISAKITSLLLARKPDADGHWLNKLPDMAKRLEAKLYSTASSREEYANEATLRTRLQNIATKLKPPGPANGGAAAPAAAGNGLDENPVSGTAPAPAPGNAGPSPSPPPMATLAPPPPPPPPPPSSAATLVNDGFAPRQLPQPPPPPAAAASSQQVDDVSRDENLSNIPLSSTSEAQERSRGSSVSEQRETVLRQQQQRLLLLRHASRCLAKPGACPATTHCGQMKELWRHIAKCKSTDCQTPHCVSSRYVLSHYHKCREPMCDVCKPVRDAINRHQQNRKDAKDPPESAHGEGGHVFPDKPGGFPHPQAMASASSTVPASASTSSAPPAAAAAAAAQPPVAIIQVATAPPDSMVGLAQRYYLFVQSNQRRQQRIKEKEQALIEYKSQIEQRKAEFNHVENRYRQLVPKVKKDPKALGAPGTPSAASSSDLPLRDPTPPPLAAGSAAPTAAAAAAAAVSSDAAGTPPPPPPVPSSQGSSDVGDTAMVPAQPEDELEVAQREALRTLVEYHKMALTAAKLQVKAAESFIHAESTVHEKNLAKEREAKKTLLERCGGSEEKLAQLLEQGRAALPPPATVPLQPQVAVAGGQPGTAAAMAPPPPQDAPKDRKKRAKKQAEGAPAAAVAQQPPPVAQSQPVSNHQSPAAALAQQHHHQQQQQLAQHHHHHHSHQVDHARGGAPLLADQVGLNPAESERQRFLSKPPVMVRKFVDTSLLNGLERKDIEEHIASLMRPWMDPKRPFKASMVTILRKLLEQKDSSWFRAPVDITLVPDYRSIIKHPMDLGTIKNKLDSGEEYRWIEDVVADVRLVFSNALLYNNPSNQIYKAAVNLNKVFEKELARLAESEARFISDSRFGFDSCKLCCREKLLYELPTYYCASSQCQNPYGRIPRGSQMYVGSGNNTWCRRCYLSDQEAQRDRVVEKVNSEVFEEDMVQCCWCLRWYHNVCAMINNRGHDKNKSDDFLCPLCVLRAMDNDRVDRYPPPGSKAANGQQGWKPSPQRASDLPETLLSKRLEALLAQRVLKEKERRAVSTETRLEDLEEPGAICVRVVLSQDNELYTRDGIRKVYAASSYPTVFPMLNKVILMFEKIDGIDVLLFVMFLQYYGSECPSPNRRTLYVAYLDSVNYFKPSYMRTALYHELIGGTIAYEREMGYTRVFIWACPPTGGDDYILHIKPKDQKVPKALKLRNWYLELLEDWRQRGVVTSINSFYDEYFARVPDLTYVPYFQGDWWPSYVEKGVEELVAKRSDPRALISKADVAMRAKKPSAANAAPGKNNKSKKARKMSKENPEELAAPVAEEVVVDYIACPVPKPLEMHPWQDALTAKVSAEMERLRDDFMVVKMFDDCAECALALDQPGLAYWLPPNYDPKLDVHDYTKRRYAPPYALCHTCYLDMYQREFGQPPTFEMPLFPPLDKPDWAALVPDKQEWSFLPPPERKRSMSPEPVAASVLKSNGAASPSPSVGSASGAAAVASAAAVAAAAAAAAKSKRVRGGARPQDLLDLDTMDGGDNVLEPGKIAKPPNPWTAPPCPLDQMRLTRAMIRPSTKDVDPRMSSHIFAQREEFLNMCQGNKLQFDELRRAKYSSMMVLFHLHNPNVEAFVHTCDECKKEIDGDRYNCPTCTSFDMCESCYAAGGAVKHPHQLRSTKLNKGSQDLQMLALLEHSCGCVDSQCQHHNCLRMKVLLNHPHECQIRTSGGCQNCVRFWKLLSMHAKQCHLPPGTCKVMHCDKLKMHMREKQNNSADRRMTAVLNRDSAPAPAAAEDQAGEPVLIGRGKKRSQADQ